MTRERDDRSVVIPKLVEAHGASIYGLGLRMCGDPQAAEELMQETFLQAFRKWDQFEGRSKPSTWLYTIAARLCQRHHRRRAGEPERLDSLDELLSKYRHLPALSSQKPNPLQTLIRKERHELAEAAINRLPARFRLPLLLKELAGLSTADVAKTLGIKEGTVKTRIHRARLFLATEIAQGLGKVPAAAHHSHGRQACLELVRAKQEALDRGVALKVTDDQLCERCRMLFRSLDLASSVCGSAQKSLPPGVGTRTSQALHRRVDYNRRS